MAKGRAGPQEEPMARGSFGTLYWEGAFDSNYRDPQCGLDRDLVLLHVRCQEVAELLSGAIRDLALAIIVPLSHSSGAFTLSLPLMVAEWLWLLQHHVHSQSREEGRSSGTALHLFSQCVCEISRFPFYVSWPRRVWEGQGRGGHITPQTRRACCAGSSECLAHVHRNLDFQLQDPQTMSSQRARCLLYRQPTNT